MDKSLDNNPSYYKDGSEPDLSDYKKIVQEKERFQKILENKVKELDRSNKELEEFAYIASHDLQEPLRKITSFSERLKEKLPADLEPEIQMYLSRMLVATNSMRMLIDNLLEFSRTSRHSEPFASTDLNTVVAEVRADLELKIEETKAAIESEHLPVIDAIPMQMRQLFTNLFSNAIKFRRPGEAPKISVSSSVLTRQEKEARHLRVDEEVYMISIQDNGIGFEQEEYPGSGIGLAICKKIVDNHKGVIYALGDPATGAAFNILLPQHQTEPHD
jgi:light-regulated signal transduction histidine kinase (bacteriophytochrome)